MPLPLLPGLKASDDAPSEGVPAEGSSNPLAQFLDGLDDSQIQELVASAEAYDQANPDEVDPDAEQEPDPEDAAEASEDEAPVEGDEEAPADDEVDDAEASPQDLDAIDQQVSVDVEEAAHVVSQMQEIADSDSDSAPDVAKILKQTVGLQEKIAKCQKSLAKAIKNEDTQAAAQAGIDARDYLESMQHMLAAAQSLGKKTEAPAMTPGDHPAIKLWAAKTQGKKISAAPVG